MAEHEFDARYSQRLSDQITSLFYEACKLGSLETAKCLVAALESEIVRSTRLTGPDRRQDGDDLIAVRARLTREVRRKLLEPNEASAAAATCRP